MITQLLNRDFLVSAAEDTRLNLRTVLAEGTRRRGDVGSNPLDGIDDAAIAEFVQALTDLELPPTAPKDDVLFMPRDPLLSILQTVIDEVAREQRPQAISNGTGTGRRAAAAPRPVAVDETFDIPLTAAAAPGRRAWGAFEVTRPKILSDPRWVWSGAVILWNRFKNRAPFVDRPAGPIPVAGDARIVLVGDWGSGIPRARAVAEQIRKELDDGLAARREQHVVHLGDVYYTGGEQEYNERFLPYWPVRDGEDIGSYTLNGNHDMYQGGHHYYDAGLADPRFARQEGTSWFSLKSPHWQFLALDTSYDDKSLHGGQLDWIRAQLEDNPDHKTALLSHHQLFSAYEEVTGGVIDQIQPVLDSGRVDAWFWAHEHRCLVYNDHRGVRFSSCVGHGGIPEYLIAKEGDPLPDPLAYDYRLTHGSGLEPFNTFGFAVVELDGPEMRVKYVDEEGRAHYHWPP